MKTEKSFSRALALLLAVLLCASLSAVSIAAAGDTPLAGVDGTVDVWNWKRVDSQADLPEDSESHPVLLMYQWNGGKYMLDAEEKKVISYSKLSDRSELIEFLPATPSEGIYFGDQSFRTLDEVGHLYIKYTDAKDGDNQNSKIYRLSSAGGDELTLSSSGQFHFGTSASEEKYRNITVMTPDTKDEDASLSPNRVMLFVNVWGPDYCMMIDDSNGRVYTESNSGWDMGQFVMYIGYREQLSAIRSDCTISGGQVANYNGYIYVEPNVTITIEKGGVLSVSGVLFNNGTIVNNGGDIVVQKGATIEQFCLNDGPGGVICCDGGDLVILSGGCVVVGKSESYSRYETGYGNGFVLRNGATCTNFGTLVVTPSAYVVSGATLDNRSTGRMYFEYRPTTEYRGRLNAMSREWVSQASNYETVVKYNEKTNSIDTSYPMFYVGKDVLLRNEGAVYLGVWAWALTDNGVAQSGTGTLFVQSWARIYGSKVLWGDLPGGWSYSVLPSASSGAHGYF